MCTRVYVSSLITLWACVPGQMNQNNHSDCLVERQNTTSSLDNNTTDVQINITNSSSIRVVLNITNNTWTNTSINYTWTNTSTQYNYSNSSGVIDDQETLENETCICMKRMANSSRANVSSIHNQSSAIEANDTLVQPNHTVRNFSLGSNHTSPSTSDSELVPSLVGLHVLWTLPITLLLFLWVRRRKNSKIKHWQLERVRSKSWQGPPREKTPINTRWKSSPLFEKTEP